MAVTKIKAIHVNMKGCIEYICNKDKTDQQLLVSGYACSPDTAWDDFTYTTEKANSIGRHRSKNPVLGYHLMQSFVKGEVDADTAHEIGEKLASEITGGKHEYVVTTHINTDHIHNHIIFNNVSFETHERFRCNKGTYWQIRKISDRLCEEHGLSVIKEPKRESGMHYHEYQMRKKGKSYKGMLQKNLDECVSCCENFDSLIERMKSLGYEIKSGKHLSFRAPGQTRFTRSKRLGEEYTEEALKKRITDRLLHPETNITRDDSDSISGILNNGFSNASDVVFTGLIIEVRSFIESPAYQMILDKKELEEMNRAYIYLRENGIDSMAALNEKVLTSASDINELMMENEVAKGSLKEYKEYLKQANLYLETSATYKQYCRNKTNLKFYENNRREIVLHEAARNWLKGSKITTEIFNGKVNIAEAEKKIDSLNGFITSCSEKLEKLKTKDKQLCRIKASVDKMDAVRTDKDGSYHTEITSGNEPVAEHSHTQTYDEKGEFSGQANTSQFHDVGVKRYDTRISPLLGLTKSSFHKKDKNNSRE